MTEPNDTERPPAILETIRFVGDVTPLLEALAKAQAEFTEMDRDAKVKFEGREFFYATLAEVLASVRPALNKHGIFLMQPFDGDKVTTVLALGPARIEVDVLLPEWKGVQALGSALTYVKRYQLKSILGVNDGDDDDGNGADGTGKKPEPRAKPTPPPVTSAPKAAITPEAREAISGFAKKLGWKNGDLEGFSVDHGCGKLAELNEAKSGALIKLLEAAVANNPGAT